ncbi:glycosyltransferase [Vibrio fluvialis]|nr:glycosyltransferase [Vibrio fluvialis]
MRVLQVSKLFPPFWGGIETVVYDTAQELKQKGVDVDILCVSSDNKSELTSVDGIKVIRCSSFLHAASTYLSHSFIKEWLRIRNDYDLIHVHLPNPLAMLAMYLFPTKAKIVVHWHSDIIKQRFLKVPFIPVQSWLLKKCDKIIVTSQAYADGSNDLRPFLDKVKVIPIGIQDGSLRVDENYLSVLMSRYKEKRIVFSLGRHVYYKGFEYLIDAASHLPDDYIILLGGEGELSEVLKQKVIQQNLTSKVVLLGRIPFEHLGAFYKACDVFCLPSIERSEAFGVVQLEAMSFGKPVVSTEIEGSGVSWVNKNGQTGLISPVKDSKELANCITSTLNSDTLNTSSIKAYFNEHFLREKMGNSIFNLYKEVV